MNNIKVKHIEHGNGDYSPFKAMYIVCDKAPKGAVAKPLNNYPTTEMGIEEIILLAQKTHDEGIVLGGSEWMDLPVDTLVKLIMRISSVGLKFAMQTTYTEDEVYEKLGRGLSMLYEGAQELPNHVQNTEDKGIYNFIAKMCMLELFEDGYVLAVDMMNNPTILEVR